MTIENKRRRPWFALTVACLLPVSLAGMGCSADVGDLGADHQEDVAQVDQAIQNGVVYISVTDSREVRNVKVGLEGRDMFTNRRYLDWEYLPTGALDRTYDLQWYAGALGGNYLSTVSSSPGDRLIRITDVNQYPGTLFTDVTVAVGAEISGSCHYDWETIGSLSTTWLRFNGWDGQWENNCWAGDFLRSPY